MAVITDCHNKQHSNVILKSYTTHCRQLGYKCITFEDSSMLTTRTQLTATVTNYACIPFTVQYRSACLWWLMGCYVLYWLSFSVVSVVFVVNDFSVITVCSVTPTGIP